ncbi:MAG: hypothetical protein WDN69_18135 [Aliidongia sp.]
MPNGALPPFDLAEGGLLLAFVRSLSVMALFSAYARWCSAPSWRRRPMAAWHRTRRPVSIGGCAG